MEKIQNPLTMKPKILFCGYREWSLKIYGYIEGKFRDKAELKLARDEKEFEDTIKSFNPGLILFIGWSWIIDKGTVSKFLCICLHPSPLPKYRGGSPLQHQIINGEKESAATLFRMNDKVDKGPILWQEKFSLNGDLSEIFERMYEKGKKGAEAVINKFLNNESLDGMKQDESKATYFKRRTPEMSEIKTEDFEKHTAEEIYNKIRALQDPYPNAFIRCRNNTKLYIQKAKIDEK